MSTTSNAEASGVIHGHRKIKSHLGIRGVAASAVVMYHLGFVIGFHFDFERRDFIFGRSYLFVDLFFILSGFIISYANKADRLTPLKSGEASGFFKNRFARIYPLHFVCLYAIVLYSLAGSIAGFARDKQAFAAYWPADHIISLIAQTALVQSIGPPSWIDWNVPSWSISAEVFSYIAFVILVNIRSRNIYLQIFLLIILPLGFYAYVLEAGSSLDIIVGIAPLRCLAGFSLGMLAFYFRDRLERFPDLVINVLQAVSVAVVFADLALNWNDLIIIPAFALLVYSTWSDRGLLSRFLSVQPIQYLGEISYSIYLTHVPIIDVLNSINSHVLIYQPLSIEMEHALFMAVVLAVVFYMSRLTYEYIEKGGRDWILKVFPATAQNRAPA